MPLALIDNASREAYITHRFCPQSDQNFRSLVWKRFCSRLNTECCNADRKDNSGPREFPVQPFLVFIGKETKNLLRDLHKRIFQELHKCFNAHLIWTILVSCVSNMKQMALNQWSHCRWDVMYTSETWKEWDPLPLRLFHQIPRHNYEHEEGVHGPES